MYLEFFEIISVQGIISEKVRKKKKKQIYIYIYIGKCIWLTIMWRKEAIHQELKDATIIHLFKRKRKGNPQVCDNHRGITLLSIAGKILARVLLNRLNEHLELSGLLPESQCGFRKNRGIIDMIFTARQLQDKGGSLHDLCRPYQSI